MEAYLATLPEGLDAHPQCRQKASIARHTLQRFVDGALPPLPAPLQALVDAPPPASLWIPEVHATALFLAICDAQFPDDDTYVARSLALNRELLQSPLYRMVMFVAAPAMLIPLAGRQWATLHRGSTLTATALAGAGHARSEMRFPASLFPALLVRCFATAQQAVVEGSGGRDVRVELRGLTSTRADYDIFWT
jgi:hypothetical protein